MIRVEKLRCWNKNILRRFYGKNVKSAKLVRQEFIDYFRNNAGHEFIKSSPVVPYNDLTTPFVNAGMNQFKGVLLGLNDSPATKVVNSQKCIRVGGKHNDIEIVGSDTYHHTFFEMLGNWSFGDYFKKEACEYAWNLITGPFNINKNFLYVTYFKGDEQLGIPPDLECKEIWRKLGVPEDRILSFGTKDNFWEMGLTGPCGPCTEIHIDHCKHSTNQAERVNKGHNDLTELWNIVFIQYQRLADGSVTVLPKQHVDTGMGFERLLAALQNKRSNYDTDLFQPLFVAIEKFAKVPKYGGRFGSADKDGLDTGYRILADHARMITVALADGALPDQNPKLSRIMRKAINVSENLFRKTGLLHELTYRVVESLGEAYPELEKNIKKVQKVIHFEEEILKSLRCKTQSEWNKIVKNRPQLSTISDLTPGLIPAYKELQTHIQSGITTVTGAMAYKLYDTYGLGVETISEIAKVESLNFDVEEFNKEFEKVKKTSRSKHVQSSADLISENILNVLVKNKIPKTDDSSKYMYTYENNMYKFPVVKSKLLDMVVEGNLLSQSGLEIFDDNQLIIEATVAQNGNIIQREAVINPTAEVAILLEKTPCFASEGGQLSDKGFIRINNLLFLIKEVRKIRDYIFHIGHFVIQGAKHSEFEIQIGEECMVTIDENHRFGLMRHHTATHLLNAALRQILSVSGQRGSFVSKDYLKYDFSNFGTKLGLDDVLKIENLVNDTIKANTAVKTKTIDMLQMLAADDIVTIPGEIYPDDKIRIVEIDSPHLKSKEACCGTHVHSTSHLDNFCILNLKSEGRMSCSIKAAVGPLADQAKLAGENFVNKLKNMENEFSSNTIHNKISSRLLQELDIQIKNSKTTVPYVIVQDCLERIQKLQKFIQMKEKEVLRDLIEVEMKNALQSSKMPFVVHYLQTIDDSTESFPLSKVTKMCSDIPVFVISYNGFIEARCCVPKEIVSDKFNAQSWMKPISRIFDSPMTKSSNAEMCNMKPKKIFSTDVKILIDKCINEASKFASLHLSKPIKNSTEK